MMEQSQANLEVFAATLLELARQDSDLLVVTSDSRGSAKLAPFAKAAPGQPVVRLAELAVEQADQYIKTGKTDKPEKQTIDCVLINPENVTNYSAFSLKE
jgi:transketolase C-terminal domain/subunit